MCRLSFVLAILAVLLFAACPEQRPTATFSVCPDSGLLAGKYCPAPVDRTYYQDPRPGEPVAPRTMCDIHHAPDPSDPDPIVKVEACAETGLNPGEWCVDRKMIDVRTSALPLAACNVHTPPRVRVYLGAIDLIGATGDWRALLKRAREAGATGLRLFCLYSWNSPAPISPYIQVGTWVHDNGITFPLYRLGTPEAPSWNPAFWTHLAEVLEEMKRLNLTAWLVAEDFCSIKGDSRTKYFNPFLSSEEALGPSTPGGLWGDAMKPFHAALFQKIIETANASGVYYVMEVMNEYDRIDSTDAEFLAWHIWSNDAMIANGFPRARIVASPARCAGSVAGQVGIYSPHGIGRPDQIKSELLIPTSKTIFSSDGFVSGSGPADAKGRRGVGLDVADVLALKLISVNAAGYELFDRGIWGQNNDRGNCDLFSPAVLLRMTRGF